ncbi:hypothetical protein MF6394_31040 [Pseudomonas sp. MF6394]|nr:hypothetical protein MF6394_31040 [Pseudomonas sp. MF6394]OPB23144.1 hypothetical protein BFW90_19135 [Pseudomonas fluorescens]
MRVPGGVAGDAKPDSPGNAHARYNADLNVGAGLLAKAVVQSLQMLNDIPHSRASPLPQWICGVFK